MPPDLKSAEMPRGAMVEPVNPAAETGDRAFSTYLDAEAHVQSVVSRLAGGVAHDLNNLLLVVRGYVELAVEEPDAGPAVKGLLSELINAIEHASAFVGDLGIIGMRGRFNPLPLDLSELVRGRRAHLVSACPAGVEIRTSLAEGLKPVAADERLMVRVLEALCARAAQAMPGGGLITIETVPGASNDRSPAILHVKDTGAAIGEEARGPFFEPYIPGREGSKGLGLGMSAVSAAVKRMGGQIRVCAASAGSDIEIALPAG